MGRAQLVERLLQQLRGRLLVDRALGDEPLRVRLAHGTLLGDPLGLQRLRVRGLVLLVVTESAIADEIDDDVVAELLPVREREPDRGDRGFRVVGVDVDDRDVEALGEVARVPGRAPLGRIGREADLVVRDDVQGAARRVAVEGVQVEGLGDDALAGERRVAVDQDRHGDRGVVDARAARAIGLLGPREAFDDRVDGLEVAGVRRHGHLDLSRRRGARLRGREVVLDVARAPLLVGDQGVDGALALELPQDRRVRAARRCASGRSAGLGARSR